MNIKKNQHFVPVFYLKRFASNPKFTQIGLFTEKNGTFVANSSIKSQSRAKYFYDKIIKYNLIFSHQLFCLIGIPCLLEKETWWK